MRSKNLVQLRKRSAGSKQQPAPREFHALFLRSRFKLADCAVGQSPRLGHHPRNEFTRLSRQHFLGRVIRLPEFICESFNQVDTLPRQHNRRTLFKRHRNNRAPTRVHAKPHRRLFRLSHSKIYSGRAPSMISFTILRSRVSSSDKTQMVFLPVFFSSVRESGLPAAPSRSSLRDKTVPLATLAPWPLRDSSSWDPNPSGCFPLARLYRVLQKPASFHSRVPLPHQLRL